MVKTKEEMEKMITDLMDNDNWVGDWTGKMFDFDGLSLDENPDCTDAVGAIRALCWALGKEVPKD
jgi:hypothetical protein